MSFLTQVSQKIKNIEYSWKNPVACVVLIPGVSLIVQKIKLAQLEPASSQNLDGAVKAPTESLDRKKVEILKWHLLGSLTQLVVCAAAIALLAPSVITSIALLGLVFSLVEVSTTYIRALLTTVKISDGSRTVVCSPISAILHDLCGSPTS